MVGRSLDLYESFSLLRFIGTSQGRGVNKMKIQWRKGQIPAGEHFDELGTGNFIEIKLSILSFLDCYEDFIFSYSYCYITVGDLVFKRMGSVLGKVRTWM